MKPEPPLIDWSVEARESLCARDKERILALLEYGFRAFTDSDGDLTLFGFSDEWEAAAWSFDRFRTGTFDETKLAERSWRIFTQPRFWLTQKCGLHGYRRRML